MHPALAKICALADYLVLLLEAVAVGGLHQVDVLEQVSHADGWVQLAGLVGRLGALAVVARHVQQAARLGGGGRCVVLICGGQSKTERD